MTLKRYRLAMRLSGALAAATLVACANRPPALPPALTPAASLELAVTVPARGVQIYECRQAGAEAPRWAFVAPEAALLDAQGRAIGRHGAGPHWTFDDGASITGRVAAGSDSPVPDAIPWLLLDAQAKATTAPALRPLQAVRQIVRTNTHGGTAPQGGCDASALGRQLRVPYTADYLFYVAA